MNAKRTSLDTLDLGAKKSTKSAKTPKEGSDSKIVANKIQRAIYFKPDIDQAILDYVLDQKRAGNRGASFTQCANEAMELFIADKGLIVKKQ